MAPVGKNAGVGETDDERYKALFAATQEGLLVVDDAGVYTEVNDAYARMLKSAPAELTGRHFSEFIPAHRLAEAMTAFASLREGAPGLQEFPLIAVDGAIVECEWTAQYHFRPGLTLCSARDVTARKQQDAALRASEARFRAAVSAVSSVLWTNNALGQMEGMQPGWGSFTGQSYGEYQGYGWSKAVHPEDAQPTIDAWNEAVAARRMFIFVHRVRRHDGVYRLFSLRAVPVFDESGGIAEWVGVHTDITEERELTRALQESEARLRGIYDGTYEYIGLLSPDGTLLEANRAALDFDGSQRSDVIGRPFWETPWVDTEQGAAEEIRSWVAQAAAGEFVRKEVTAVKPSGERLTFDLSLHPVRNDSGEVIMIVPEGRDISERKQAEALLRDSEEGLRLAQAAAGIGIWEWDLVTNEVMWSPEIYQLLGLGTDTSPSLSTWEQRVHPDDRERALQESQQAIAGEAPLDTEFRIVRPDGEVRWLLSRARLFKSKTGEAVRFLGLNMDVTERKCDEQRTAFLLTLDDETRPLTDPQEITQTVATLLGRHLNVNRCAYAEVETDEDTFNLTGDYNREVPSIVGRYRFAQFGAECLRMMRTGEAYVVTDTEDDPRTGEVRESYRATLIRSVICVPLLKQERLVAAMAVHQITPRRWRQDEVELLEMVAGRCWESIERARAEAELRRQRHAFHAVLSNLPDLICTFDVDGRLTYANLALQELWQKPLSEVEGKTTFEIGYPLERAARVQGEVHRVIETRQPVRNYAPYTRPDGQTMTYEYIFSPVLSESGQVESVTCSARDITERKRIEQELADSKEKLQQVFAQAPVGIVVFRGPEFKIELANPSYCEMVQNRQLTGLPLGVAIPELSQNVWDALKSVLETGVPFAANDMPITYDRENNGQIEDHWFNVVYHPLREADGAISGVVAVCSDVTAQVTGRRELERANRELEEFAYVASHDLQEPLRMVGIFTEMLLTRHMKGDAEAVEFVGFIQQGVRRMEKLIRDLLLYSRTIHNEGSDVGTADLNLAAQQAVETMERRIKEAGAVVTLDHLPEVRGDADQIALVFQNLLSNSLKYRRADATPEIRVSAKRDGEEWIISVQDNGIGFQQQYAERIFGLFKRLHKDEYPGTGLGLAICQRVVERYGGRIWAEGREDAGATVFIALREA